MEHMGLPTHCADYVWCGANSPLAGDIPKLKHPLALLRPKARTTRRALCVRMVVIIVTEAC